MQAEEFLEVYKVRTNTERTLKYNFFNFFSIFFNSWNLFLFTCLTMLIWGRKGKGREGKGREDE